MLLCRSPIARNYESERIKSSLSRTPSFHHHPLLGTQSQNQTSELRSGSSLSSSAGVRQAVSSLNDPLAALPAAVKSTSTAAVMEDPLLNPKPPAVAAFIDPLMNPSSSSSSSAVVDPAVTATTTADHGDSLQSSTTIMKEWIHRREKILYEYAVSGNITLSSKAMVEIKGSGLEDGSVTRHLDKYDQRLAHLEKRQINEEEGEKVISLTHIEYSAHVDKLVAELEQAWMQSKLVDSLRIAIQISKLLSDTTAPSFYPYSFIKVT